MRSNKLANKFYTSLTQETQQEMKAEFTRRGWADWERFLLNTVEDYMKAEYKGEQVTNGAPMG